jgi:hypothetical protein
LKKRIRDLEGQVRRLQTECEETKGQWKEDSRDADAAIKRLEDEVSGLEGRIGELQGEITTVETELGERDGEIRKLGVSLQSKNDQYDQLVSTHASTQRRAESLAQEAARARSGEKSASERALLLEQTAEKETRQAKDRISQTNMDAQRRLDDAQRRLDLANQNIDIANQYAEDWSDQLESLNQIVRDRFINNPDTLSDFMQHTADITEPLITQALARVIADRPAVALRLMRLNGIHPDGVEHWIREDFRVNDLDVDGFNPWDINELYHFICHCARYYADALDGWPERRYRLAQDHEEFRVELFRTMTRGKDSQSPGWWRRYVVVLVNNEEKEGRLAS